MSFLARQASNSAAALRRALFWVSRIGATRKAMTQLARMSDAELRDIGLVRQDIVDVSMLRLNCDRSGRLAGRRSGPERRASTARDLAA